MIEKHPNTTHFEHHLLVLLGNIADALDSINAELERLNDRQGAAANYLAQLSDNHGSTTAGPF